MTAIERRVLRAVAVLDAPCRMWFLERMVARPATGADQPVDAAVEELVRRNVLVDTAAGLRLDSRQLRDTIMAATPPSVRRTLHEKAAVTLAVAGHPAQAARQLLRAMPAVNRATRALVARLVTDPAVSPALAANLLLADGAPADPGCRLDWLIPTTDNLFLAGRITEALALLHDEVAADRYGPRQRALLLGRLGTYYATQRPSLAMDYLNRALAQHPDVAARSWTLTMLASVAARYGHPDIGQLLADAERAHAAAPALGGEIQLAMAHAARASATGQLSRAGRILQEVDAGEPTARSQAVFLRLDRIANQLSLGRFADARTALDAVTDEIETLGAVAQPLLTALDCVARLALGELAEAEARARLALKGRDSGALPEEARIILLATVVEVLLRRGEVAVARALLAPEHPAPHWPNNMQWIRLGCAVAADPEPGRHAALVRATLDLTNQSLTQLLLVPHHGPGLVRAALLLGDRQRAERLTGQLKRVAGKTNNKLWRGIAHHVDGLMSGDPAALRTAVARLRTTSARLALADALFDLARSPQLPVAEARTVLAECAALYVRLGASGDQDRARQLSHEIGDGGQSPPHPSRSGVAALTPAETRVADLLARGATKQQAAGELFISFHTVDTHLRAIYAKLGVRSRVELARVWDARPGEADDVRP